MGDHFLYFLWNISEISKNIKLWLLSVSYTSIMDNDFKTVDKIWGENGYLKLPNFQRSHLSILDFLSFLSSEKEHRISESECSKCGGCYMAMGL